MYVCNYPSVDQNKHEFVLIFLILFQHHRVHSTFSLVYLQLLNLTAGKLGLIIYNLFIYLFIPYLYAGNIVLESIICTPVRNKFVNWSTVYIQSYFGLYSYSFQWKN